MKLTNCIIDSIKTMKDKSLKVTLITRELPPNEMAQLFYEYGCEVEDMEIETLPEDGEKSPAQRLRACLFRLWEAQYKEKYKEFEVFYRARMDKLCEMVKEKIN